MFTEFGSGDPQTVKLWAKFTLYDAIKKTWFNKLVGNGDSAIVQRIMDLEKSPGDTVKYDLLYNMKSYGVNGDQVLKGFEESLRYAQDSVVIDQKRLGHRFARMSQQRTVHDLRSDGRRKLSDRWAVILDKFMAAYLCGTAGSDTALAAELPFAGNALQAPDAAHAFAVSDTLNTDHIDALVEMARTMESNGFPNIRPAMVDGEEKYLLLIHPYQATSLRSSANGGSWFAAMQQARERGASNPLYSGALAEWNGVIIHVWERLPINTGPLCFGAFLGAQAATIAFGNAYDKMDQERMGKENYMSWYEDNGEDYGNQKGLACGAIFGVKKNRFTDPDDGSAVARDFGVIRVQTTDTKAAGY